VHELETSRDALDFMLLWKSRWRDFRFITACRRWLIKPTAPDHALFDGALHKAQQTGSIIFFKGILANWIVCLAVRIALRCKEEIAKILVLILVVFIFVYLGFEHSIANMGTFSMAILGGGTLTVGEALHNLLYSTLGNVVGGVLLVGLPFTYLNPREREEQMQEVLLVREAPGAQAVSK
jgi:formate/nitrite transporter FocA (FNT family)